MPDYGPVLQARIHNCYLNYINSLDTSTPAFYRSLLNDLDDITFPEDIVILIINWPQEELGLGLHVQRHVGP